MQIGIPFSPGDSSQTKQAEKTDTCSKTTQMSYANSQESKDTTSISLANRVYTLWKQRGLFASPVNPSWFVATDFANGMKAIKELCKTTATAITDTDIITACENYATTLNDPASWWNARMSFSTFASKHIGKFLPGYFHRDSFVNKQTTRVMTQDEERQAMINGGKDAAAKMRRMKWA